jgi:hypothetical protein
LIGSNQCAFHGGKTALKHKVRISELPKFYSSTLKSTLAEAIEVSLNAPVVEQLSLLEELALMRGFANQAIILADAAMAADVKAKECAIIYAIDMLKHVASLAEAATRCDKMAKDKVSVHDLNAFVHQMVRIAYETMPEKYARKFEKTCHTQLHVVKTDDTSVNIISELAARVEAQTVVTDDLIRRAAESD